MDFYTQQLARKRPWTPTCGERMATVPGAEQVLGRALALRILELEVAEWLDESLANTQLPDTAIACLRSNILDEQRHDLVLGMAAKTYPFATDRDDLEAQGIHRQWLDHPDHPLVKAFVLENSVFFVILPLLRTFGGVGLGIISADISGDESVHAAVHRQAAKDMGYTYSPSLDRLRRDTVAWLVDGLRIPEAGRSGRPQRWLEASDRLLYEGASDLIETRRGIQPAFFEIANNALPSYS
ncbi:MAG: ferritin-like domain-containing protein [Desertifilum sp. SIO1I2]|nr:ferritin-like domain-containing protein [Desertifilum sp. SIO1I2]